MYVCMHTHVSNGQVSEVSTACRGAQAAISLLSKDVESHSNGDRCVREMERLFL